MENNKPWPLFTCNARVGKPYLLCMQGMAKINLTYNIENQTKNQVQETLLDLLQWQKFQPLIFKEYERIRRKKNPQSMDLKVVLARNFLHSFLTKFWHNLPLQNEKPAKNNKKKVVKDAQNHFGTQ